MGYSSCLKLIDVRILVLNFKAMFSAQVKVRKKDFCVVSVSLENSRSVVLNHTIRELKICDGDVNENVTSKYIFALS